MLTIERVRTGLVAGAVLLLALLAVFLGVARYRAHRFLRDLPSRLGADIQRETNTFTYSQAVEGRTVFTIHAARAVQHVGGVVMLHDVGIVLYGRDQKRTDRIYGEEFEYDQKNGIVRARGEVHLDLSAMAAADASARADYAAGKGEGGHDQATIHARTSDLVYEQRTGVVSTEGPVEFTARGVSGHARGAVYDTARNVVSLSEDVRLSGVHEGRPTLLTATHAEMQRETHVLEMRDAHYITVGETPEGGDGREEVRAKLLHVTTAADGRAEHAEASGGVSVTNARGTVEAPAGSVRWGASGRPELARMTGGLVFRSESARDQGAATAEMGEAKLNGAGRIERASLLGRVSGWSQTRTDAKEPWGGRREIAAARLDMTFMDNGSGGRVLEQMVAQGGARVDVAEQASGGTRPGKTTMRAELLTAHFRYAGRRPDLVQVDGDQHTVLERTPRDGGEERSTGDSLSVKLGRDGNTATGRRTGSPRATGESMRILDAEQRGNVTIRQIGANHEAREALEAHASEAHFDGEDQLRLLGGARVLQTGRSLQADEIDADRNKGSLTARGAVNATYAQAETAELIHVTAARAEFARERGQATFYGVSGNDNSGPHLARAWQGGSQVEAPVLILRRAPEELLASVPAGSDGKVHTTLVSGAARTNSPANERKAEKASAGPMQVTSQGLQYTSVKGQVEFTGGVVLRNGDATLSASEAVAFLRNGHTPAQGGPATGQQSSVPVRAGGGAGLFPAGGLDRVEARGGVTLQQGGREGRGESLMYTAASEEYLLTGTPSTVTDVSRGVVRGRLIRFFAHDRSVTVTGDPAEGSQGRVRSELRLRTANR